MWCITHICGTAEHKIKQTVYAEPYIPFLRRLNVRPKPMLCPSLINRCGLDSRGRNARSSTYHHPKGITTSSTSRKQKCPPQYKCDTSGRERYLSASSVNRIQWSRRRHIHDAIYTIHHLVKGRFWTESNPFIDIGLGSRISATRRVYSHG